MIYLCSVYSYKADEALMQKRFECVERHVANSPNNLFSPIVYSHGYAKKYQLPKTYGFWSDRDQEFIELAESVHVLMMPHWEDSDGITREVAYAKSIGKPIVYVPCHDYWE